jgi:multisubunit Na+/H+ antiporter MnhE subunit
MIAAMTRAAPAITYTVLTPKIAPRIMAVKASISLISFTSF